MELIFHNENLKTVIVKMPPIKRSIFVAGGIRAPFSQNKEKYFLSFPSILYRINYHGNGKTQWGYEATCLDVAFTNESNDLLYPFLPNVWGNLQVCVPLEGTSALDLNEMIKLVIKRFWATEFNTDVLGSIKASIDFVSNEIKTFKLWEEKTKSCPSWVPSTEDFYSLEENSNKIEAQGGRKFYTEIFKRFWSL